MFREGEVEFRDSSSEGIASLIIERENTLSFGRRTVEIILGIPQICRG
jgi:hypothetical protein